MKTVPKIKLRNDENNLVLVKERAGFLWPFALKTALKNTSPRALQVGRLLQKASSPTAIAISISIHFAGPAVDSISKISSEYSETSSINLSRNTLGLSAYHTGEVIGVVTITGGSQRMVVLAGKDAANFSVSNGGMIPCNLIAARDMPAESYSITLSGI